MVQIDPIMLGILERHVLWFRLLLRFIRANVIYHREARSAGVSPEYRTH